MTNDEHQRASGRRARRRGRTWSAHRHRADRLGPPGTRRAGLRRGTPHAPGALQPPTAPGNQARAARPESERPSPGPEPPSPRPAPPRPDNGWAVETHGLTKRFGPTRRGQRRRAARPARLRVRLPRPERRGQDHPDPGPCSASPAPMPARCRCSATPVPKPAGHGPGPGRGDRRRAPLPRAPDRPAEPPPLAAAREPAATDRGSTPSLERVGMPAPSRGQGGEVLDGHAPAPRRRRLPARRSAAAHPGRADERARSRRHARDAGDDPSLAGEGRTVVLSSHLLDEVERTCDAVAIVDHGRVIRQGSDRRADPRRGSPRSSRLTAPNPPGRRSSSTRRASPRARPSPTPG